MPTVILLHRKALERTEEAKIQVDAPLTFQLLAVCILYIYKDVTMATISDNSLYDNIMYTLGLQMHI